MNSREIYTFLMARYPSIRLAAVLFISSLLALSAPRADTVTLKSGEKFSGDISFQDDTHIVINVQVSAGITDQRRVMRTEIASIEKTSTADAEFENLETLKPGDTSLGAEQYDSIIQRLEQYQKNHPDSQYKDVVQDRLTAFKAEKQRVDGGEIKINKEWITKEDAEKRRYQIAAQLLYARMAQAAQRGDYITALNTFEILSTKYPGSRSYVQSVPVALQVLNALRQDVDRRKKGLARDMQVREQGIEITSEPKKSQLIAAVKREEAQYEAAIQASVEAGLTWPPMISRSMASLDKIESAIEPAEARLTAIDLAPMKASLSNLDQATQMMTEGRATEARAKLEEAQKLWAQNEALPRAMDALKLVQETPPEPTEAEIAAEAEAAAIAAAAEKEVTPVPAPPEKPTPFFLTIPGAAVILGAVVVVIGLISLLGRVKKSGAQDDSSE